MLLKCPKCGVKNYLDPYPFWNFKGKTKCAGCDVVYAVEIANGSSVRPPQPVSGTPKDPDLLLPGFADTPDNKPGGGGGKPPPAPAGPGRRLRQAEAHREEFSRPIGGRSPAQTGRAGRLARALRRGGERAQVTESYFDWTRKLFDRARIFDKPEALRGIRVLELTTLVLGPTTADFLGEFGAEVV